jgi:hypothetical protein
VRLLSYWWLVPAALLLGAAPFSSEPHLLQKLRMLLAGELARPIDVFDLALHGSPLVLLAVRVGYDVRTAKGDTDRRST